MAVSGFHFSSPLEVLTSVAQFVEDFSLFRESLLIGGVEFWIQGFILQVASTAEAVSLPCPCSSLLLPWRDPRARITL